MSCRLLSGRGLSKGWQHYGVGCSGVIVIKVRESKVHVSLSEDGRCCWGTGGSRGRAGARVGGGG